MTFFGGVIAWARRVEAHMSKALTREEHERICSERNLRVEKSIDELREDIDSRHAENRETLGEIRDTVTGVHERMDTLYRDLLSRGPR